MTLFKRGASIMRCVVGVTLGCLHFPAVASAAGVACEDLVHLSLPKVTIKSAQTIAKGEFPPPSGGGDSQANRYQSLPSFCRVAATAKPTPDSDIQIEVWMPVSGWNNKFDAVGNGGWAGSIRYADMAVALAAGYATASTD